MDDALNSTDDRVPFVRTQGPARAQHLVAAAFCFVFAVAMCLPGCAGVTAEEAIEASLSDKLDQVKSLDQGFISTIASYMDVDRFSDYGVDGTAFVTAYFDGFDYTIDSIAVDDDTARAIVTLTCTSYSDFRSRLSEASNAMAENADEYVDMSRDDLARTYGTLLMNTLDSVELAQTKPLTITFERDGDTWKMQESLESEIASFLLTN